MQHWYVYHSQKTMKRPYSFAVGSAVFSTKNQPKLCNGDIVWVVDGDLAEPSQFKLADCFRVEATEIAPLPIGYEQFKVKASASSSLLLEPAKLGIDLKWFELLHARYITKQRFFHSLSNEPEILDGLRRISGVKI
ncbi:hypothetical protein [Nevskia ramosa]|uniref:hypothetical protein n=1 Tax=Nevskia ramosa TaxID=64002 RepID=UPI00235552DE|nr:hypothetical protein [Nevskia ramosa]